VEPGLRRPLLFLALAIGVGATVGGQAGVTGAWLLLCLAGSLILLGLLSRSLRPAAVGVLGSALAVGAAAAASERVAYEQNPLLRWVSDEHDWSLPVELRGQAARDAMEFPERWILVLDVRSIRVRGSERPLVGRVRVSVRGGAPRPEVIEGDGLRAWVRLRLPSSFGNPGAFDHVAHARRTGVHALGYCKTPRLVSVVGRADLGALRDSAARTRRWARHRLKDLLPPGVEQGVVRAMVLGDRTGLDPETTEAFRIAGTYHVLAISGAQVALLAAVLIWGLGRLRLAPVPMASIVIGCLVFYAELVGGDVPVVRAATMASVLVLGRCWDLEADMANLLGGAAALLLLARPSAVGDLGFQLSFAATLGIILLTPVLLAAAPRLPLRLEMALAASLAAQAALLPLLTTHFHRLAPAALLLNLVAVPLASAVLLSGMAMLLASAVVPPLAGLAADVGFCAAHALLQTGEVARHFPALDPRIPSPPLWAVVFWIVALVALLDGRRRRRGMLLACAGLVGLVSGRDPDPIDGRLHLTALDVGQGDCLVLRSPLGRFWLVDTGGSYSDRFDVGEAVVAPYLWSRGVRRLSRLLLTHAHRDHVGGAPFLLGALAVGETWEGPAPLRDPLYETLSSDLEASGVARRSVFRGVSVDWDGVRVEVLGPARPRRPPSAVRNDDSVVLRLGFGNVRFLLTGDIEALGEAALGPAPATVLKVPHHGGRESSTAAFLRSVHPSVAVFSVGRRNSFGHPAPEVVRRYQRRGCRIYRTDYDGAVTVSTDGTRVWVQTFRGAGAQRVQ